MIDKNVTTMWVDATNQTDRDAFASDWGLSTIWGAPEDLTDEQVVEHTEYAGRIWDAAHMSARDLVAASGMTQAAFADRFLIAKRTVESWCGGQRQPPEYVRFLLALALDLI